jgi:hypothetical protein
VVFRHPVAPITPALDMLGKVERIAQRIRRRRAKHDGRKIKD